MASRVGRSARHAHWPWPAGRPYDRYGCAPWILLCLCCTLQLRRTCPDRDHERRGKGTDAGRPAVRACSCSLSGPVAGFLGEWVGGRRTATGTLAVRYSIACRLMWAWGSALTLAGVVLLQHCCRYSVLRCAGRRPATPAHGWFVLPDLLWSVRNVLGTTSSHARSIPPSPTPAPAPGVHKVKHGAWPAGGRSRSSGGVVFGLSRWHWH